MRKSFWHDVPPHKNSFHMLFFASLEWVCSHVRMITIQKKKRKKGTVWLFFFFEWSEIRDYNVEDCLLYEWYFFLLLFLLYKGYVCADLFTDLVKKRIGWAINCNSEKIFFGFPCWESFEYAEICIRRISLVC
jgi:hypothetical protein